MPAPDVEWIDYIPDCRDDCIERARRGLATPDEIEAELATKGLPPLASEPDAAKFDPMVEPWWTLSMCAAWIIWRNAGDVRRAWDAYRYEVKWWVESKISVPGPAGADGVQTWEVREGWEVRRQGNAWMVDEFLRPEREIPEIGVPLVRGGDACQDMWRKLQSGELVVEAIPHDCGPRAPIRAAEWVDLSWDYDDDLPADAIARVNERQPRYLACRSFSQRLAQCIADSRDLQRSLYSRGLAILQPAFAQEHARAARLEGLRDDRGLQGVVAKFGPQRHADDADQLRQASRASAGRIDPWRREGEGRSCRPQIDGERHCGDESAIGEPSDSLIF